jgi:hypothetical protein
MWTSDHNVDIRRAAHRYEPTREAAIAAFARSWRRSEPHETTSSSGKIAPDDAAGAHWRIHRLRMSSGRGVNGLFHEANGPLNHLACIAVLLVVAFAMAFLS